MRHSDHRYLFHWYAQDDQSLRELHVVSLGRTLVHIQCHQVLHHLHCFKLNSLFSVYVFIKTLLNVPGFHAHQTVWSQIIGEENLECRHDKKMKKMSFRLVFIEMIF